MWKYPSLNHDITSSNCVGWFECVFCQLHFMQGLKLSKYMLEAYSCKMLRFPRIWSKISLQSDKISLHVSLYSIDQNFPPVTKFPRSEIPRFHTFSRHAKSLNNTTFQTLPLQFYVSQR